MEERVNTSDSKAYNTKGRLYKLPTVWDLRCRRGRYAVSRSPSDSALPSKQKTGQAERLPGFLIQSRWSSVKVSAKNAEPFRARQGRHPATSLLRRCPGQQHQSEEEDVGRP